jgi:hypothetical protein
VRAVSDAADEALSPRLAGLVAGGRVRPLRLAAYLVRRPTAVGELRRLARATRRAADRLAPALAALLGLRQPWCGPVQAGCQFAPAMPDRPILPVAQEKIPGAG